MNYHLLYRSVARFPFPHFSDLDILRTAWAHNAQAGLTGYLVRTRAEFFQVLEGPQREIAPLFERIRSDSRHHSVKVLAEGGAATRRFATWAMGYAEDVEVDPVSAVFALPNPGPEALIAAMADIAGRRGGVSGRAAAL